MEKKYIEQSQVVQENQTTLDPQKPSVRSKNMPLMIVLGVILWCVVMAGYFYGLEKIGFYKQDTSNLMAEREDVSTWKTFNSPLLNFSFKYPSDADYKEVARSPERLKEFNPKAEPEGLQVFFDDSNKKYLGFDATTPDFKYQDAVPHDLISGNLDSKDSFAVVIDEGYGIIKEVSPGMYFYSGYSNMECSSVTDAYLFVKPPSGSNLKYIGFFLGHNTNWTEETDQSNDYDESCYVKEEVINKAVQELADGKIPIVKDNLEKAIKIAQTFSTIR